MIWNVTQYSLHVLFLFKLLFLPNTKTFKEQNGIFIFILIIIIAWRNIIGKSCLFPAAESENIMFKRSIWHKGDIKVDLWLNQLQTPSSNMKQHAAWKIPHELLITMPKYALFVTFTYWLDGYLQQTVQPVSETLSITTHCFSINKMLHLNSLETLFLYLVCVIQTHWFPLCIPHTYKHT